MRITNLFLEKRLEQKENTTLKCEQEWLLCRAKNKKYSNGKIK